MASLPLYGLVLLGLSFCNFRSAAQTPATPAVPANVASGDVSDLTINDTAIIRGGLADGLYTLRLQTADGKAEICKLTLQSK